MGQACSFNLLNIYRTAPQKFVYVISELATCTICIVSFHLANLIQDWLTWFPSRRWPERQPSGRTTRRLSALRLSSAVLVSCLLLHHRPSLPPAVYQGPRAGDNPWRGPNGFEKVTDTAKPHHGRPTRPVDTAIPLQGQGRGAHGPHQAPPSRHGPRLRPTTRLTGAPIHVPVAAPLPALAAPAPVIAPVLPLRVGGHPPRVHESLAQMIALWDRQARNKGSAEFRLWNMELRPDATNLPWSGMAYDFRRWQPKPRLPLHGKAPPSH
jgi:hypothetical protein